MNGTTLILAFIGHLVGDYLLQNDWMALHKKKSTPRCLIHCFIWTVCVCGFAGWYNPAPADGLRYGVIALLLFATHFIQDRTNIIAWWMDAIGQKQFRTGPCAPWSMIAVDNIFHILTIVAVWKWIA